MTRNRAEEIKQGYETNSGLIKRLTEDITHKESLLQLPFPANCLNWVLGHIIVGRNTALGLLSAPHIWGEDILSRYRSGSEPITDGAIARQLSDLLSDLDDSQRQISAALAQCTREELEKVAETDRGAKPVWQHLAGLHWHETYHVGQLEIFRANAMSSRDSEHR